MAQAAAEKKDEAKGQQQLTTYTVQMQQVFDVPDDLRSLVAEERVSAWVDLGTFKNNAPRGAVKAAMDRNEIDEGDFRAIPATSSKVHSPRVTRTVVWD